MNDAKSASSTKETRGSRVEDFDLVILGTGSTLAAWTFASEGKRVAVVERKYIGGSCPNIACLPNKNVINSAEVVSLVRRAKEFGIVLNMAAAQIAMIAGLPHTAFRNAVLTHPTLVEGLIPLFSSTPSVPTTEPESI